MANRKIENVVGALALAVADNLLRETQTHVHVSAPAAALALLRHVPGMTIDQLRRALGLSHPGAVRLVDRLEADGLLQRTRSTHDGRAVALVLTTKGEDLCRDILASRQNALKSALAALDPVDRQTLGRIAETLLRSMLRDVDHALEMCRLCDPAACTDCPIEAEVAARDAARVTPSA